MGIGCVHYNITKTMQALSHYSYHFSDGQRLVCDLQGGYYGDYYILTDPVIEVRGCSLAFTSASDGSMAEAGRAMRTLVAQGTLGKSMVSEYCLDLWCIFWIWCKILKLLVEKKKTIRICKN